MPSSADVLEAIRDNILAVIDDAEDDEDVQEQLAAYEDLLGDPERMWELLVELGVETEESEPESEPEFEPHSGPPASPPVRLALAPLEITEALRQKVRRLARKKYPERRLPESDLIRMPEGS